MWYIVPLHKPGKKHKPNVTRDIFKQVYGDSYRADWNLNGRKVSNPSAQTIVDALTTAVKNPNALKVISILMNQRNLADLECLFRKAHARSRGRDVLPDLRPRPDPPQPVHRGRVLIGFPSCPKNGGFCAFPLSIRGGMV